MKTIAIIPARYNSTRFPGKPLALILGKPMIQWVYESVSQTNVLDDIIVATDDQRIIDCVDRFGGRAIMTRSTHECGSDRLAECVDLLNLEDEDIVLNIQGDEPLINPNMIVDLVSIFEDPSVYMGTLKKIIEKQEELDDPNVVKIITNVNQDAIYFSRYCIPFERNSIKTDHYKHIGVYGYKTWFLKKYSKMSRTRLEIAESLEQLRAIENGLKIRVKNTMYQTIGVDTPEQIGLVERELTERRKK